MSDELVVIDISHWQESNEGFTWDEIRDAGIVGAILKATEGTGYIDDRFAERYDAAIEASFPICAYHFLRHGSVQTQMNLFINTVDPRDGERMILDWEDAAVTLEEVQQAVDYLKSDSRNLQVTIYGSSSFLNDRVDYEDLPGTDLWVASYTSKPDPTAWGDGWDDWTMWQYTDKATVLGFSPLDGNRFNGTREQCAAWLNPTAEIKHPRPAAAVVTVDIQAPPHVSVRVKINGADA